MEIESGPFQRRVSLAEASTPTRAEANYERGLLTIVLPLAPEAARRPGLDRARREARANMSELAQEIVDDEEEIEVPSMLPVLPLKETVVFPQS